MIDNTIIFAASPIVTGQAFSSGNKTYNYKAGTGYGETAGSITVMANHYGASDLRVTLQGIATNENYFTSTEQGLMNDTTVTTKDIFNKDSSNNYLTYTTTDKLYSLTADGYGSSYNAIKAGSDNSTVLAMSRYWSSGDNFWLRYPDDSNNHSALLALPGDHVSRSEILEKRKVQPASNIDLTNVLFASAAKDGSLGPLNKEDHMLLRFDGSSKNLGNISYDNENIYVSSDGDCTLFVQGRNGEQNWYYTFQLTGNDFKIGKNDIIKDFKGNASLSLTDIDLSKCKIWIERKDSDGLLYAVEAKEAISSVDISVEPPVAGYPLITNAVCNTTGIDITMPLITWYATDETAIYSKTYKASITLTPEDGYVFVNMNVAGELLQTSAAVKDSIKGENVKVEDVKVNEDGTLTVKFDLTAKDSIIGIEQPALTYENGTPIDEFKLPDKVKVTGYSGKEYQLAIFPWDAHPDNNYDPECKVEQTLVYLSGLKEIPDGLDYRNPDGPDVKLTITIKAAKTSNNTGGNHTVIIPDTSVR